MGMTKYLISKEFKKGVAARVLREQHDWDQKPKAFIAGYKWASDNIADELHRGINQYLGESGEELLEMATVQSPND